MHLTQVRPEETRSDRNISASLHPCLPLAALLEPARLLRGSTRVMHAPASSEPVDDRPDVTALVGHPSRAYPCSTLACVLSENHLVGVLLGIGLTYELLGRARAWRSPEKPLTLAMVTNEVRARPSEPGALLSEWREVLRVAASDLTVVEGDDGRAVAAKAWDELEIRSWALGGQAPRHLPAAAGHAMSVPVDVPPDQCPSQSQSGQKRSAARNR